jgi:hypothetical protein
MRYDPYYEEIKGELLFEHVEVISKPFVKKIKDYLLLTFDIVD